jgi:hypothetical protein
MAHPELTRGRGPARRIPVLQSIATSSFRQDSLLSIDGIKSGIAASLRRLQADELPQEQRWADAAHRLIPDAFAEVRA